MKFIIIMNDKWKETLIEWPRVNDQPKISSLVLLTPV